MPLFAYAPQQAHPHPHPFPTNSLCSVCAGLSLSFAPFLCVCVQKLRFLLCRRFTFFISLVGLWHMTVTVRQHTQTHRHAYSHTCSAFCPLTFCTPSFSLSSRCYQSDLTRTLQIRELHHANIFLLTPYTPLLPPPSLVPHLPLPLPKIYLPKKLFAKFSQLFSCPLLIDWRMCHKQNSSASTGGVRGKKRRGRRFWETCCPNSK